MTRRLRQAILLAGIAWLGAQAHAADTPADGFSAASLYNQANAYARAGKPGLAVLDYERAQLLAPEDADIRANLRFVRSSAKVPLDPPSRWERVVTAIGPSTLACLSVLGIVLIGGSLIAGQVSARRRGLRRLGMVVGIACVGIALGQAAVLWPATRAAVVVVNATPALVSPVPMGDVLFTLPEAETVHITAEHESYLLVRTRAGRAGWVSRANVAPVMPK